MLGQAGAQCRVSRRGLAQSGGQDAAHIDALDRLARASEGFSGSELEAAVVSGLYVAKSEGKRLSGHHILDEMARTQPLSVVMAERIDGLREWADGRTVPVD